MSWRLDDEHSEFTELSRRYEGERCVRANVRELSAQLRSSYLGGYRPPMGRGAFYDTVSVYVVAPG